MSGFNARNGMKAAGPRQATHSPNLESGNIRCPACGSRHVLTTQSKNGKKLGSHWCGQCSGFSNIRAAL